MTVFNKYLYEKRMRAFGGSQLNNLSRPITPAPNPHIPIQGHEEPAAIALAGRPYTLASTRSHKLNPHL